MPNFTERSKLLKRIGADIPKRSTNTKINGLRLVLLQNFNQVHSIILYMTKPLMAGYTSANGQWLAHYSKQAYNKFLPNRKHYLGSIKEKHTHIYLR